MPQIRTLIEGPVSVVEYRCDAGPQARAYWEAHHGWSVSFVTRGTFSCQCRGRVHELVPGSVLLGRPGDEYRCTHEHHGGGDECLAVHLAPEVVDDIAPGGWHSGAVAPCAQLMVSGERMRAASDGDTDIGLDEAALAFAARHAALMQGPVLRQGAPRAADRVPVTPVGEEASRAGRSQEFPRKTGRASLAWAPHCLWSKACSTMWD